jgi:hypothetical protein
MRIIRIIAEYERKEKEFTNGLVLYTYVRHYDLVLRATLCSLTCFSIIQMFILIYRI